MENIMGYIAGLLWDWPLIIAILSTGMYFTLSSGFFQIKYFSHIYHETFGSIASKEMNHESGGLSTFEAFFAAIGTTAGAGNITGVATAISVGGPGSIFWMILTAVLGMIIKTAEVTLAVYYRDENEDGTVNGGPMQYIEKGIGLSMNFKSMAIPITIFSIGIMSTLVFTVQNYNASLAIANVFHVHIMAVASVYGIITYFAIYKGIKGIARMFMIIVPIITLIYVGSGLIVMLTNIRSIIPSIRLIIMDAFTIHSVVGGMAGRGITEVIRNGVARAVYSNEAGWGTSPMIHSMTKTDHPVKQGMWGAVEVFFDTIIICTTTTFVIVVSGTSLDAGSTSELVMNAFGTGIGSASRIVIPLTLIMFGLTTSIGWYSYYESVLKYISRRSQFNITPLISWMKVIYPLPGFMMVLYAYLYGIPGKELWDFMDIIAGLPTFVNIFAILILSNKFFELLKDYETRYILCQEPEETIQLFYSEEEHDTYYYRDM